MSVITSPNMNLSIPVVTSEPGPNYAFDVNSCLAIIDSHNHVSGAGVAIPTAGLNINADLPMGGFNLIGIRSARYNSQSAVLSGILDLNCVYTVGVDLYYNDGNGNQIRITQSGGVAGSPGSISNLTSPASAAYVAANSTFVWQSAANTPANLDAASIVLRNLSANSKGLTLNPPAAMAANYSITLPSLPASQSFVTIDASGNFGAPIPYSAGITGSNIASNVSLPGKAVQENGNNLVVSNTNATNSLAIIRGVVSGATGSLSRGEGFTSSLAATGFVDVTFSSAFSDVPVVIVSDADPTSNVAVVGYVNANTTGVQVYITTTAGAGVGRLISFVAIGQRA